MQSHLIQYISSTLTAWFLLSTVLASGNHDSYVNSSIGPYSDVVTRPIVYTYLETLEGDFNGMSNVDHNDLLEFWMKCWHEAGFHPIVLRTKDALEQANRLNVSTLLLTELSPPTRLHIHKWIAMTARGGLLSDYDTCPLHPAAVFQQFTNVNGTTLTLHEVIAPTLASGHVTGWIEMTKMLLHDAKQSNGSFWTDTLALLEFFHRQTSGLRVTRQVLQADKAIWEKNSSRAISGGYEIQCDKIPRKKLIIHFGPLSLQRAVNIPNAWRTPRHRVVLARDWMTKWKSKCR